jgi:DNA-binding response OmpR family regulator
MDEMAENSDVRILVIDDDDLVRKTIKLGLEAAHYQVEEATDGAIGLEIASQGAFDLVITDILMPNKEGIETIQELRREKPAVKIIAISGGDRRGGSFLEVAAKLGADKALRKPFRPQELLDCIQDVLAK